MTITLDYKIGDTMSYRPKGIIDFYYEAARGIKNYAFQAVATMKEMFTKYKSKNDPWYLPVKKLNEENYYEKPEGKNKSC